MWCEEDYSSVVTRSTLMVEVRGQGCYPHPSTPAGTLGDQPAEMLLQLCQEHVAEMERETPEGESQTDMKAEVAETPEPAEA